MIIKTMALRVQLHRFEPNTSYERISHIQSAIQHILSERHPHLAAHYYVARGDFRGRFLSLEPKDGESWGVSGHLFQQDNPNLDIDEAIGELLDDIDGLDHGASDGDTSDEDGEEETPIAPNRFSPDARGRTTGIFGRSEPTTRQSPRRHQAVRPAHLMMDDDDDDDSDEEDPLEALARFGEDRQRQIRAAANQNMAENADASGLDSVLARNMAELNLSPVVDDAEMRNITGQPETNGPTRARSASCQRHCRYIVLYKERHARFQWETTTFVRADAHGTRDVTLARLIPTAARADIGHPRRVGKRQRIHSKKRSRGYAHQTKTPIRAKRTGPTDLCIARAVNYI